MGHKDDFTMEWCDKDGKIVDVRISRGTALYRLPWYRRILLRLLGRSHWHHFEIERSVSPNRQKGNDDD